MFVAFITWLEAQEKGVLGFLSIFAQPLGCAIPVAVLTILFNSQLDNLALSLIAAFILVMWVNSL
jgi:hypothetical protein